MENPRRISLVTLMGLPGCGKTTLCQELIKFSPSLSEKLDSTEFVLILFQFDAVVPFQVQSQFVQCPTLAKTFRTNFLKLIDQFVRLLREGTVDDQDQLVKKLAETELLDTDAEQEQDELLITKSAFISAFSSQATNCTTNCTNITSSSIQDYILLIDDNNYYKSMRNAVYQIAKSNSTGFCVLYPKVSVSVCQERNLQRLEGARVPCSVIDEMAKKLEEPNPLQNPADALCLQITDVLDPSTHQLIFDTLIYTLQNTIQITPKNDPEEASRDRRICAENEIHQADLILRKWIHTELALCSFGTGRRELKIKGQQLQEKKTILLQRLRIGEIQVTSSPGDEIEFRKQILTLVRQVKLDQVT